MLTILTLLVHIKMWTKKKKILHSGPTDQEQDSELSNPLCSFPKRGPGLNMPQSLNQRNTFSTVCVCVCLWTRPHSNSQMPSPWTSKTYTVENFKTCVFRDWELWSICTENRNLHSFVNAWNNLWSSLTHWTMSAAQMHWKQKTRPIQNYIIHVRTH